MPKQSKGAQSRSIRTNLMVTMTVSFLLMFVLLFSVFFVSMQNMLVNRENDSMRSQVQLSQNVLYSSVSYLPSATRDWSSWDNTYDFVQGNYDDFLKDSLTEYPFQLYRLNFLVILDTEGNPIFERFYDYNTMQNMDAPAGLQKLYKSLGDKTVASFHEGEALDLSNTNQIGVQGFVGQGESVYYVSSFPVIHSDETGPCVGSLIFGKMMDATTVDSLNEKSGLAYSFTTLDAAWLSEEQKQELAANDALQVTGPNGITSHGPITDIFGKDSLLVTIQRERTLYNEGNRLVLLILVVMILCCLLILGLTIFMLNRIVIRPLANMMDEVRSINMETLDTTLQTTSRNTELNQLSQAINDMLVRIKNDRDLIQKNNERLFYNANYDLLTGLRNRTSASLAIGEMLQRNAATGGRVDLFFLDMDRFKLVNDTLGHAIGDTLLILVTQRLRNALGKDMFIARMGGDEFIICTENILNESDRQTFVKMALDLFEEQFNVRERGLKISVSIGAAYYPADGQDADTLVKNAEIALYEAKAMGDGMFVPYEKSFQEVLQQKITIENQMREAIQNHCSEFRAFLQPKVMVSTGKIESCEALMRWVTPEGIRNPMDFIPQAEESGLIIPLSWWMIRECCRLCRHFEDIGRPQTISINITAQVLLHENFLSVLSGAAEEYGIDIRMLDIEITESTLLGDMNHAGSVLQILSEMGAQISVDDFGTGYSSLSYLNRLNVDRIKIDRSFVSGIGKDEENKVIIRAIMAMAKSLHMVVTAEGVEGLGQYHFLQAEHCEEIQGYYISRPVPEQEYINFLCEHDGQVFVEPLGG